VDVGQFEVVQPASYQVVEPLDRAGLIASIADVLYQCLAIGLQMGFQLGYVHPVHPACSLIGTDLLVGFVQIPLLGYVFYHRCFVQGIV
jgi:hypothetical protein